MKTPKRASRRSPRPFARSAAAVAAAAIVTASPAGLAAPVPARAAASGLNSLRLTAVSTLLRADGKATTTITAAVYDANGNPIADGNRVRFTTTAGRLAADVVATQGGVARVELTAADQPGVAQIVAVLDTPGEAVPATLSVTFSKDADASETGTQWIRIDGDTLGYVLDYTTVEASGKDGGARIQFRGLTISADHIQFNTKDNTLLAIGSVTVTPPGGDPKKDGHTFRDLRYSLLAGTGEGERIGDDGIPQDRMLTGPSVAESAPGPEVPPVTNETWKPADLSNAQVTVVARSIAIEPNQQIQFRRATFWVQGSKTASFPFHIIDLQQGTLFEQPLVGFGPTGVSFDVPLYYDVRPSDVGSVHLRRGAAIGSASYSVRPIWSLDLVQSYNGPHNAEGKFELDGITREDWSMTFQHGQRLDPHTTGSLYLDLPNNKNLFANTAVSRQFNGFHVDAAGSGTRSDGVTDPLTGIKGSAGGDLRGQLTATTNPHPFWGSKALNYTLTTGVSRDGYYGTTGAVSQGVVTTRSVGGTLDTMPLPIASGTKFRQSFALGQTWVTASADGGESAEGLAIRGTSAIDHSLGNRGSTTLTYDYTQSPPLQNLGMAYSGLYAAGATPRHRLGMTVYLIGGPSWTINASGSQGLDIDQATLLSALNIRLHGPWSSSVSLSQMRLSGFTYREIQYSLTRTYQGKNFTLSYSTTAKRFFFNFAGLSL